MVMTRKQRADFIKRIPWVTYVSAAAPCDAVRAPACKNVAHWRFRSLKRSIVRDGVYCMSHLINRCFYGDLRETDRLQRWQKRVITDQDTP